MEAFTRIALSAMDWRRISDRSNHAGLPCTLCARSVSLQSPRLSDRTRHLTLNTLISATPSKAACTRIAVAAPPALKASFSCPMMPTPFSLCTHKSDAIGRISSQNTVVVDNRIAGAGNLGSR